MGKVELQCDSPLASACNDTETQLNPDQSSDRRNCFRATAATTTSSSTSSLGVVIPIPGKFEHSLDSGLLRQLSSNSLQDMSQNQSDSSIGSYQPVETTIPRRNLTEAFEELYIEPPAESAVTPAVKGSDSQGIDGVKSTTNMISPTGVADLQMDRPELSADTTPERGNLMTPRRDESKEANSESDQTPYFFLYPDLKRDLSQPLVNRVSFYGVLHDINKEATAMASNDDSGYNRNPEDMLEDYDPLVVAVNGLPQIALPASTSMSKVALVDEERWLLEAIDTRGFDESRFVQACPPTFPQAMGERDYENPLASLSNASRTQLWKPSRSWWEAKSGKNPWIEPKSHNKRWRYLWPLIHYHKFLARCIKKLKRNGVDVKTSVSPVAAFLREEVCAVSDHLAGISLFDSDEWMNCLQHFNGWADSDEKAEARLRELVATQKLRPLDEPGDVDSPLLRSQIDEQFLRAMSSSRAQMAGAGLQQEGRKSKEGQNSSNNDVDRQSIDAIASKASRGHPPSYPRATNASPAAYHVPQHIAGNSPAAGGVRRPRWGYPSQHAGQWWGNGWNQQGPFPYGDDMSVHSGLSGDSYSQHHYDMNAFQQGMGHPQYYPPMMYPQHQMAAGQAAGIFDPNMVDPSMYSMGEQFSQEQMAPPGWGGHPMGDPWMAYGMPPASDASAYNMPPPSGTPGAPPSPHHMHAYHAPPMEHPTDTVAGDQTPYKYNPSQVPISPYWGHLDHATLAMMGIASPQGNPAPQTPRRDASGMAGGAAEHQDESKEEAIAGAMNAQPLLLRQQYHGYGYGNQAYGPPSPATQFMMSPQASFAYNYGYGFSPRRPGSQRKRGNQTPSVSEENATRKAGVAGGNKLPQTSVTPPPKIRASPVTVDTTAESESLGDAA